MEPTMKSEISFKILLVTFLFNR